jgi:hypothetical protein
MAKKTITQNNVEFSVDTLGNNYQGWDKKYTNINNIIDSEYDPDGESLGVNAVDIDCSF